MRHEIRIFARLLRYIRPYMGQMVVATFAMVGVAAMTALSALIIKNILDDVFLEGDRKMLMLIPLVILMIYVLKGIFRYVRVYLMSRAGVKMVQDIRNDLYRHLQQLSLSFFTDTPTGVLMSRVTYDVGLVQTAITEALIGVFRDAFMIVGLACVVFYRNAQLGLLAIVGLPIAFYPLVAFGRRMKKASRRSQEQMGSLSKLMQERIGGAGLVKAFGTEEKELDRFQEENRKLVRSCRKIQRVKALSNPVMAFSGAGAVAVFVWSLFGTWAEVLSG